MNHDHDHDNYNILQVWLGMAIIFNRERMTSFVFKFFSVWCRTQEACQFRRTLLRITQRQSDTSGAVSPKKQLVVSNQKWAKTCEDIIRCRKIIRIHRANWGYYCTNNWDCWFVLFCSDSRRSKEKIISRNAFPAICWLWRIENHRLLRLCGKSMQFSTFSKCWQMVVGDTSHQSRQVFWRARFLCADLDGVWWSLRCLWPFFVCLLDLDGDGL